MRSYDQQKLERQTDADARRHFVKMATQVSTKIGTDFFHVLAEHLAQDLDADSVYIGEFVGGRVERVRTLAVFGDGDVKQNFEFPLSGSPEEEVASGNPSIYLSDLQSKFPSDLLLSELSAEACVALPLNDSVPRVPGLIGAFYRRPLREAKFVQKLLTMFAPRVLAELKRKQAEDTLRESEQRYRAFVKLNPVAMWRVEFSGPIATDLSEDNQVESILQHGYLAECNDALARLLGKERPEQLIGARVDILSPSGYEAFRGATKSLVRSGYQFETVETSPMDNSGKRRHFLRTHWGIVENSKLQRIWGTSREITELRQCQMALSVSEKQLSDLLETLHLTAIMLDREGVLSFCNDYLLRLTGWRAEEIVGKNWFDQMVPQEEREKHRAMFSSRTKVLKHFDGTLLCRDDRRLLVGWDYVVIPGGTMSVGRVQPRRGRART
jgi:two-component system cell cycle sensor histidine kinase/response regulator CckA